MCTRSAPFCLSALLALASCVSRPPLPAGKSVGLEMQPREVIRFAVIDASPQAYWHRTLLVDATVAAVCQNKGCWMQIEDQGHRAMVRWETGCGGKFAFPKDLAGRRVLIQGSFYPKEISEADARHLEEEAGGRIRIDREGSEFNASSILVLDEQG